MCRTIIKTTGGVCEWGWGEQGKHLECPVHPVKDRLCLGLRNLLRWNKFKPHSKPPWSFLPPSVPRTTREGSKPFPNLLKMSYTPLILGILTYFHLSGETFISTKLHPHPYTTYQTRSLPGEAIPFPPPETLFGKPSRLAQMGQLDVSYYIERISGWTYYKIITTNVRRGREYGWGGPVSIHLRWYEHRLKSIAGHQT